MGSPTLLVVQRLERVQLRRPPRREDRGEDPHDDRRDVKTMTCVVGKREHEEVDPRDQQPPRTMPEHDPEHAPISAVITLSCRIIRRTWRRVIPIARSIPISRVRSKTVSTSVFTIPNRLTITDSASST